MLRTNDVIIGLDRACSFRPLVMESTTGGGGEKSDHYSLERLSGVRTPVLVRLEREGLRRHHHAVRHALVVARELLR